MSKQFQLYLTPSDAVALVEELRSRFGARVLSKKSSTSDPVEMESPIDHESIFSASGATSIHCYLAPANGRIITNYFPTLRRWLMDTDSEAIEFSDCDFDGKTLCVGRFYFQTDDLVGGRIVKKRAEFLVVSQIEIFALGGERTSGYWSHRQCDAQIVSNLTVQRRLKVF